MWLRLFWPCVVRIGRQLDQCLRDLVVGDRGCFLAVCVVKAPCAHPRMRPSCWDGGQGMINWRRSPVWHICCTGPSLLRRYPERLAVAAPLWSDGAAFRPRRPDAASPFAALPDALPRFLQSTGPALLAAGRSAALLMHLDKVICRANARAAPTLCMSTKLTPFFSNRPAHLGSGAKRPSSCLGPWPQRGNAAFAATRYTSTSPIRFNQHGRTTSRQGPRPRPC